MIRDVLLLLLKLGRYPDQDWTLCDAVSFAVLEARRIRTAFTFDHHFRQMAGSTSSDCRDPTEPFTGPIATP